MERCGDCGKSLHWIEIAFGRFNDPVCGRCLIVRAQWEAEMVQAEKDANTGMLIALRVIEE